MAPEPWSPRCWVKAGEPTDQGRGLTSRPGRRADISVCVREKKPLGKFPCQRQNSPLNSTVAPSRKDKAENPLVTDLLLQEPLQSCGCGTAAVRQFSWNGLWLVQLLLRWEEGGCRRRVAAGGGIGEC